MASLDSSRSLLISIHPNFDKSKTVESLTFHVTVSCPDLDTNESLCVLPASMPNGTTQSYPASSIHAFDDQGHLAIDERDDGRLRHYIVKRKTTGSVLLNFVAVPVVVNSKTPIGGRYELRRDQGGAQFMGMSVIPIPGDGDFNTRDKYDIKFSWDLSAAPVGTRGVSSYGEGNVTRRCLVTDIWRMVFVTGPVKSYPPCDVVSEEKEGFGFYWFGTLPSSMEALPPLCSKLFRKLADFFRDEVSKENPYCVFVRSVTPARGFGGTGGIRSFVLEYDSYIATIHQDEIFYLLAHEMVHNWPLMQSSSGNDMDLIAWYNEGIGIIRTVPILYTYSVDKNPGVADYYASVLPYRVGLVSRDEFLKRINAKLAEYYTNPLRLTSNRDVQDKAWTSPDLQTLSYTRGMVYLLQLDAAVRDASYNRQSVDEVVLLLLERLRNEERHGIPEWKELIMSVVGVKALLDFDAMNAGQLIHFPPDTFGPEYKLKRIRQRELDFGFDASSFFKRTVVGIREGSEAAKAGVQEGDEIIWNTYVWQCQTDYSRNMILEVRQGEKTKRIEYWPRSERFVESWQLSRRQTSLGDSEYALLGWEWIEMLDASDEELT